MNSSCSDSSYSSAYNANSARAVNTTVVWGRLLVVVMAAVALCGCVGNSPRSFPVSPDLWLEAEGFQLAVFENSGHENDALHIYLDGDGRPVNEADLAPNADPTPDDALVLELMRLDPTKAAYLGRPCHFNPEAKPCHPGLWTGGRYSAVVVSALCAAVEQLAEKTGMPVVLFGFSGGGALAVLVAGCAPSVSEIVTINGNLDTQLWVNMRGFLPLEESLNPKDAGLPERVTRRVYLVGENDSVVPPLVSRRFSESVPGQLITWPDFTHTCCWTEVWEELLGEIFAGPAGIHWED